jgi:predicted transglutaminase-like cysteine proteinase
MARAKTKKLKQLVKWTLLGLLLFLGLAAATDFLRMEAVISQRFGPTAVGALREWKKLLKDNTDQAPAMQLKQVNDFFNRRTRFDDDYLIWGQSDYWATPMETLGRRAGDCEDFSIAKYFTLLLLNIPDNKLRLIYVQARLPGDSGNANASSTQAHMVLAFFSSPEAEPVLLDNLVTDILPASRRRDLSPVFSFNRQGLWQGVAGAQGPAGPASLSRWQELLNRARAEGFD